jgi:hypothetical protein
LKMNTDPERRLLWRDPIVASVRDVRLALLAEVDYDLKALCQRLRDRQAAAGRTEVHRPPRPAAVDRERAA